MTSGLADELAERLLRLYGVRASDAADGWRRPFAADASGPSATVESGPIGAEVLYAFRRELAQTLSGCRCGARWSGWARCMASTWTRPQPGWPSGI